MIRLLSLRSNRRIFSLFLLALLLTLISGVYFVRYLLKPNTGLVVNFPEVVAERDEEGAEWRILFSPKTPFSPAVDAGLLPGRDQIVAVNDRPIRTTRDVVEADGEIWSFAAVQIEVLRDGIESRVFRIEPSLTPARFDWIPLLIFALILAFLSYYLIFHLVEEEGTLWILLSCLAYMVFTCVKPFYYENMIANFLTHFGKTAPWFLLLFALAYPRSRGSRKMRIILMIVITILYMLFVIIRLVLYAGWARTGLEMLLDRYRILGRINNAAEGLAYIVFGILLGCAYMREPSGENRRRMEWILAGYLIALPTYFFLDQLPYILGDAITFRWSTGHFANLFLAVFPAFYIVGMIKSRIFDFRFFLSRYLTVVMLGIAIFGFYCLAYTPFAAALQSNYGMGPMEAGLLAAVILFLLLAPLRTFLVRAADRLLYGRLRRGSNAYLRRIERENRDLLLHLEDPTGEKRAELHQAKIREARCLSETISAQLKESTWKVSGLLVQAQRMSAGTQCREDSEIFDGIMLSLLTSNRRIKQIASQLTSIARMSPHMMVTADLRTIVRAATRRFHGGRAAVRVLPAPMEVGLEVRVDPEDVATALRLLIAAASEEIGALEIRAYRDDDRCCLEITSLDSAGGSMPALHTLEIHAAALRIERNGGILDFPGGDRICCRIFLPAADDTAVHRGE